MDPYRVSETGLRSEAAADALAELWNKLIEVGALETDQPDGMGAVHIGPHGGRISVAVPGATEGTVEADEVTRVVTARAEALASVLNAAAAVGFQEPIGPHGGFIVPDPPPAEERFPGETNLP